MIAGHAMRALLIVPLVAGWGCRSEPESPGAAANPVPRTAAKTSDQAVSKAPTDQPPERAVAGSPGPERDENLKALAEMLRKSQGPPPPPLRAKAITTGDPELDPLVAFLRAAFAAEIKAGKRLVIADETELGPLLLGTSYQDFVESLLKEASDKVPAEMIRDFDAKNRQTHAVRPELGRHVPVHLLGRAEHGKIFADGPDENWERFYKRFPGSPGLITVSRVGLNREKNLALFYMGVMGGSLNGGGQLHVVKKEADKWVEQPISIGPSWQS
jgi:hypothetical protein